MFAKPVRLTHKKQFDSLFKRGNWVRGKWFSLIFLAQPGRGKIGFIVTKKTLRDSSDRNRAKRRLRAAFRSAFRNPQYEAIQHNTHIIVLIHRAVEDTLFPELVSEVERKLQSIGSSQTNKSRPTKP
jgi:ribonuclease P protein component